MKIGLIDVDGHAKINKWGATIYPNLALCKIAAYHKSKGDSVEWYNPLFGGHMDIVYMSKVFVFSEDYGYIIDSDKIIKGGTGYDITSKLPKEIDDFQPDTSIYKNVPDDLSYGFLTRGCPNKCKWCVVPTKEGQVQPYWDVDRVANGNKKIVLMDNNFLGAGDYAVEQLNKIIDRGYKVDFNQALDARFVTEDFAKLLSKVKWLENRIRFGCDTKAQIEHCDNAIKMLVANGYKGEFFLYTMLHGEFEECYERINHYRNFLIRYRKNKSGYKTYPYAQPFRDLQNRTYHIPQWQKDMAQWVNKKMIFWSVEFKDFEPRKGFKCEEYFI